VVLWSAPQIRIVKIRRDIGREILRLLLLCLLHLLSLLRLLRGRLGLLLGFGQLILHCLQLPLHRIDLLLQLGVGGEGWRGNQDGRPEHRSSQQQPQSSFDVHLIRQISLRYSSPRFRKCAKTSISIEAYPSPFFVAFRQQPEQLRG
jgi:hypothetical protein